MTTNSSVYVGLPGDKSATLTITDCATWTSSSKVYIYGTTTIEEIASWTSSGTVIVYSGGTLNLAGTINLTRSITNSGTVNVTAASVVFNLENLSSTYISTTTEGTTTTTAYTVISNSGTINDWSSLTLDNFSGCDYTSRTTIDLSTDGVVSFIESSLTLLWAGTTEEGELYDLWTSDESSTNWVRSDDSETKTYFVDGDSVIFDSTASTTTVSISSDINAEDVTVSDDYTFEFSNDATLTSSGTFTVDSGSSATISSGTVVLSGTLSNSGTIYLTEGGQLEIDTTSAATAGTVVISLNSAYLVATAEIDYTTGTELQEAYESGEELTHGDTTSVAGITALTTENGTKVTGTVSLSAVATDEAIVKELAAGGYFEYALAYANWNLEIDISEFSSSLLTALQALNSDLYSVVSYDASTGLLSIYVIPEPSLFGALAGISALTLAGTRRRRSRANRA